MNRVLGRYQTVRIFGLTYLQYGTVTLYLRTWYGTGAVLKQIHHYMYEQYWVPGTTVNVRSILLKRWLRKCDYKNTYRHHTFYHWIAFLRILNRCVGERRILPPAQFTNISLNKNMRVNDDSCDNVNVNKDDNATKLQSICKFVVCAPNAQNSYSSKIEGDRLLVPTVAKENKTIATWEMELPLQKQVLVRDDIWRKTWLRNANHLVCTNHKWRRMKWQQQYLTILWTNKCESTEEYWQAYCFVHKQQAIERWIFCLIKERKMDDYASKQEESGNIKTKPEKVHKKHLCWRQLWKCSPKKGFTL